MNLENIPVHFLELKLLSLKPESMTFFNTIYLHSQIKCLNYQNLRMKKEKVNSGGPNKMVIQKLIHYLLNRLKRLFSERKLMVCNRNLRPWSSKITSLVTSHKSVLRLMSLFQRKTMAKNPVQKKLIM